MNGDKAHPGGGGGHRQVDESGLSFDHKLFADVYRATRPRNGAKAYAETHPECTDPVAHKNNAWRLLQRPEIVAYIKKLDEQFAMANKITAERVLNEIARAAFFDPRKLFDDNGELRPLSQMDDDTAAVIQEISEDIKGKRVAKVLSKMDALKMLGKNLKLFTDVTQLETEGLGLKVEVEFVRPEDSDGAGVKKKD